MGQLIMASFIATSSRGAEHMNPRSHWTIKIRSRYIAKCYMMTTTALNLKLSQAYALKPYTD